MLINIFHFIKYKTFFQVVWRLTENRRMTMPQKTPKKKTTVGDRCLYQNDGRLDQLEDERTACVHPYITIQEQNTSKGLVHQITRERVFFILLSGLLSVYFQRAV